MSKRHSDNHAARVNRGPAAFATKAKRRKAVAKDKARRCNLCGTRTSHLDGGLCLRCRNR